MLHPVKLFVSIALVVAAVVLSRSSTSTAALKRYMSTTTTTTTLKAVPATTLASGRTSTLTEVSSAYNPSYFFSHGGPTFMYSETDPVSGDLGAFKTIQRLGEHMVNTIKPAFYLVVSAHWEAAGRDAIEITLPSGKGRPNENELIYDFGGFPSYMYKEQFHTRGSPELSRELAQHLTTNGLKASVTTRGLDHGTWVPLKVAFGKTPRHEDYWWLDVPLIQVSLAHTEDFAVHERLGGLLREFTKKNGKNGLLINSGMTVHNLRDLGVAFQNPAKPMAYTAPFHAKLREVLANDYAERVSGLETLKRDPLFRKAHPTAEHFMPLVVANGFAGERGALKEVYTNASLSLGWGIYEALAGDASI